jgi:predicted enzyme related to lactoylglutathione lyase
VKVNTFILNITTDQPEKMNAFYKDVVQLPTRDDMGETAFDIAGGALVFDTHSETHGPAKEPQRALVNFMVDDLAAEQARLEVQGVKFIRTAGREYWGGVISTFLDPDGNYCQLIEFRPE